MKARPDTCSTGLNYNQLMCRVDNYCARRHLWRIYANVCRVFRDPILCYSDAFFSTSLVLANGHRHPALTVAATGECVTLKSFDGAHKFFHVFLTLLQQRK